MTPIGKFNSSFKPTIIYDYLALEKAKYLVSKMDKEIQWFHRMDVSKDRSTYYIYDLIIPQQEVSLTETNSDSSMMLNLYRDLVKERGPEETNTTLSNMVVWCHSHHTMAPNPSGQDNKQFKEFNTTFPEGLPRLMLIFNKSNQYYSKVFDPQTNIIFENIDIKVSSSFDSKDLDSEIKNKVKNKKIAPLFNNKHSSKSLSKNFIFGSNTKKSKPKNSIETILNSHTKKEIAIATLLLFEDMESVSFQAFQGSTYFHMLKDDYKDEFLDIANDFNLNKSQCLKIFAFVKDLLDVPDPQMFQETLDYYLNTLHLDFVGV